MSEPAVIRGITCYAPELALENEDFPPDQFETLYKNESGNFWFKSRNRVILHQLSKYKPAGGQSLLEIGCGTAFVLNGIHDRFPDLKLTGSEIYISGLELAAKRLPHIEFIQLNATDMPFSNKYDYAGAFDVIEHIEEDEKVMQEVFKALKPGGRFLITVPQHKWLWSVIDEYSCHKRRYTRKELKSKLKQAGFEIDFVTSFTFFLLPVMYLARLRRHSVKVEDLTKEQINSEVSLSGWMNSLFTIIMRLDEALIKVGISLPCGGSLFVVARKSGKTV